jgi:glucosamine--fructose-6-phosphate aminotransferase (isomerizing)
MCGIFGIFAKKDTKYPVHLITRLLREIALISESRGKESSGVAVRDHDKKEIQVIRSAMPVSKLIIEPAYQNKVLDSVKSNYHKSTIAVIGHSRLVTNGSQLEDHNNQPVVKDGIVAIHNGIIVNVDELWNKHGNLKREFEIDTEVALSIIHDNMANSDAASSVLKMMEEVFGTVSTAMLFNDRDEAVLATNNGSLYILTDNRELLIFASEKFMLETLKARHIPNAYRNDFEIRQVKTNTGYLIRLDDFSVNPLVSDDAGSKPSSGKIEPYKIDVQDIKSKIKQIHSVVDIESIGRRPEAETERKMLQNNLKAIVELKRCSKCLLPETFPFIEYDEKGVCNYCNNYIIKNSPKPIDGLFKLVEPYRSTNGEPDVIIPYSGGRDSTFTLHYVKTVLKMNPIAYTYDWGMVTDLARRNIARICGKLGVENIIISADIHKKRQYIKENITAWLKKPDISTIPLFMAGDKYFFYYCNQLQKQTGIKINLWGSNNLENTDFKSGFLGLRPEFDKKYINSVSKLNQVRLLTAIMKNLIKNPSYINSSVSDTMGSYVVRYISPKKGYHHFFDYYRWDEREIVDTIKKKYDWELAKDTDLTWRIGDGTASFYNYIYYTVTGFTESDTFRSNQIREGMITREEAIKLVEKENRPRYESIKWYLDIVGLDFKETIGVINDIPKIYSYPKKEDT